MDSNQLLLEALQYHQLGQLPKAESAYRRILQSQPRNVHALYYLGVLASQVGNKATAVDLIRQAISIDASHAIFFYNLGEALQVLGRLEEAIDAYQSALRLNPADADSMHNLGRAWQSLGRTDQAILCYQNVLQMRPNDIEALNNLGGAFQAIENYASAIASYQSVLAQKHDYVEVLCNLGSAYKAAGQAEAAKNCYAKALSIRSDSVEAMNGLVIQQQELCLWDGYEALSEQLVRAIDAMLSRGAEHRLSPLAFLGLPTATTAQQQFVFCKDFCRRRFGNLMPVSNHSNNRKKTKIRIGYLSGDFRTHPVAFSICQLLENHDRNHFEVYGYSFGIDDNSAIRRRIVKACDVFCDVRQESYRQTAKRIFGDEIDILIDLMGHTYNARTEVLAMKPAPIQMQFLGFAGTMGLSAIDYLIADRYVIPKASEQFYQEKILRLPNCFFPVDTSYTQSRTAQRKTFDLPEDALVLGSFNNSTKITPRMFATWLRVLQQSPQAILWIYIQNNAAAQHLTEFAKKYSIAPERIRFTSRMPNLADHMARYALIDLFLDTFPYNAHSTTVDALRMGCPVITLSGQSFASRVAGSMLHAVGQPALITDSIAEYERLAIELSNSPARLSAIRQALESQREQLALFRSRQYAAEFDAALTVAFQRHLDGQSPATIDLSGA